MNKGVLQIVGGAALFGLIPVFLTWCHTDSVVQAAFGRAVFASLFTALILFFQKESFRITWKQFLHYMIWSLMLLGAILFYFLSIRYAGHAIPGMVIGLQPLFIALLVRFFFRERLNKSTWLSFLLAITGIVLLSQSCGATTLNTQGVVFALLCAVLLGFNFTYHLKFLGNESPFRLVFFQNLLQIPLLAVILPFVHTPFEWHDVVPFALLGVLSTGIAYYLIYAGSKTVKKQLIGFFQLIENIIPVLTGVFLMQEKLEWSSLIGIAFVLFAGIWCMKRNAAAT